MVNNVVLRGDTKIGNVGAETDDEFLFKCFIDHPALAEIKDLSNSKMFVLGSTGIGKTAILRMIKHQVNDSIELELTEMSLRSISNSSAISFLIQLDVDISLFLQALWKRVILVEYAKLYFRINRSESKQNILQRFTASWRNSRTEDILKDFLESNEESFWETTDKTVIDVTQKLETDLSAEFGGEVAKAQGRVSYAKNLGEERRTQYQERAKKYVSSDLLTQLARVTSALAEQSRDSKQSFFILIDKIDEPWVDEKLKNILIHSLFEACKSLRKIRNMKVVVALRNDVYEKMNADFPPSLVQMEKNEDFIVRIKWTKDELYNLIDKRINHLFRYKYTSTDVHFGDVFKDNYDNKSKTFSYMLDRTLNRPRDLIKFVNFCFEVAEGKSEISKNSFSTAEGLYSSDRREALVHEWHSFFPAVELLLKYIERRKPSFSIHEMLSSDLTDYVFDEFGSKETFQKDALYRMVEESINGFRRLEVIDIAREMMYRLHLMGAVGIKISADRPFNWIHLTLRPIKREHIDRDSRIEIHPMLWRALDNVVRKEHRS